MAGNLPPGYDLADRLALTMPAQVRAIGSPLRTTILGAGIRPTDPARLPESSD